jgi:hypothetical protein
VAVHAGSAPSEAASGGTPAEQVAALDPKAFFTRFAQALQDNPPPADDAHAQELLSDIGVSAGYPVQWTGDRLSAATAGVAEARSPATPPSNLLGANGWSWIGDTAGKYGQDYAPRAYAAYTQFGTATRDDETLALVRVDSDGQPLNGANRYMLHFAPGAVPPVRGFWTLTPYATNGALPDVGAARRSLGDRERLRRNRDGSIDVVVGDAGRARPTGCRRRAPISRSRCACTRRSRKRPTAPGCRPPSSGNERTRAAAVRCAGVAAAPQRRSVTTSAYTFGIACAAAGNRRGLAPIPRHSSMASADKKP